MKKITSLFIIIAATVLMTGNVIANNLNPKMKWLYAQTASTGPATNISIAKGESVKFILWVQHVAPNSIQPMLRIRNETMGEAAVLEDLPNVSSDGQTAAATISASDEFGARFEWYQWNTEVQTFDSTGTTDRYAEFLGKASWPGETSNPAMVSVGNSNLTIFKHDNATPVSEPDEDTTGAFVGAQRGGVTIPRRKLVINTQSGSSHQHDVTLWIQNENVDALQVFSQRFEGQQLMTNYSTPSGWRRLWTERMSGPQTREFWVSGVSAGTATRLRLSFSDTNPDFGPNTVDEVKVTPVLLGSITATPDLLAVGGTTAVSCTVQPPSRPVHWSIENAGGGFQVLPGANNGNASIRSLGGAGQITVVAYDAEAPSETRVTTSVTFAKVSTSATVTNATVGESVTVIAATTPSGRSVDWSHTGQATRQDSGDTCIVTGTSPGEVIVTATDSSLTAASDSVTIHFSNPSPQASSRFMAANSTATNLIAPRSGIPKNARILEAAGGTGKLNELPLRLYETTPDDRMRGVTVLYVVRSTPGTNASITTSTESVFATFSNTKNAAGVYWALSDVVVVKGGTKSQSASDRARISAGGANLDLTVYEYLPSIMVKGAPQPSTHAFVNATSNWDYSLSVPNGVFAGVGGVHGVEAETDTITCQNVMRDSDGITTKHECKLKFSDSGGASVVGYTDNAGSERALIYEETSKLSDGLLRQLVGVNSPWLRSGDITDRLHVVSGGLFHRRGDTGSSRITGLHGIENQLFDYEVDHHDTTGAGHPLATKFSHGSTLVQIYTSPAGCNTVDQVAAKLKVSRKFTFSGYAETTGSLRRLAYRFGEVVPIPYLSAGLKVAAAIDTEQAGQASASAAINLVMIKPMNEEYWNDDQNRRERFTEVSPIYSTGDGSPFLFNVHVKGDTPNKDAKNQEKVLTSEDNTLMIFKVNGGEDGALSYNSTSVYVSSAQSLGIMKSEKGAYAWGYVECEKTVVGVVNGTNFIIVP